MRHIIILLAACFLAASGHGQIPTPSAERMRHFTRELNQLEKTFMATYRDGDRGTDRLWRESKRVADRNGPDIVAAVMLRSRKWRDMEMVIFAPLIFLLPRDRVTEILRAYKQSGREPEATWADEFMTEFSDEEMQQAVRRYSKEP